MEVRSNQQQNTQTKAPEEIIPVRYCLYARKSTEQDEQQALSIDSQINEMQKLAERDGLKVVDIKRESHSAKAQGQRPVFNELLADIRAEKFDGVLTWAPDRLSRNAGDLGAVVDLMDQGKIREIRTFGQTFSDNPNEKFLLMILGSQAKLENDNKRINVKRGLRARCEQGLWPSEPPTGYLPDKNRENKCRVVQDPIMAPIVKQVFEKVAYEEWSIKKVYLWLRNDMNFRTRKGKVLSTGTIQSMLRRDFYYGKFEYPKGSGNWYTGIHKPIISEALFRKAGEVLDGRRRNQKGYNYKQFAFTKLIRCGLCGSGVSAEEKYKHYKNGKIGRFVYYGCSMGKDRMCKRKYINEKDVIKQLAQLVDDLELNEFKIEGHIKDEIRRFRRFQNMVLDTNKKAPVGQEVSAKKYIKYILQHGSDFEKRDIAGCIRSQLYLKEQRIYLE